MNVPGARTAGKKSGGLTHFLLLCVLALLPDQARAAAAKVAWSAPLQWRVGAAANAAGLLMPQPLKPRPVILWLHGGMRSSNREKGFTAMHALKEYVREGSYYLVSPSAYAGEDWLTPAGIRHIDALLDTLESGYPVRMDSLIIAGVSDGCLGALRYAQFGKRKPRRFLLFSAYPQLAVPREELLRAPAFRGTRWDVFQGGRDRLFPAVDVLPLLRAWEKANPNVRVHYYPEGEHDFGWYASNARQDIVALFGRAGKP